MELATRDPVALDAGLSSPNLQELVASFLSGRNERTLQAYGRDLEDFRSFLGVVDTAEASRCLLAHGLGEANSLALRYRSHLLERELSPSTINRRLSALRSLVKLARTTGLVPWKLEVSNVKSQPYRDTRGPGKDGVSGLFEEIKKREAPKAKRDFALFRLLYDLALRRAEVVSLDLEDVDLKAGTARVTGKGRTEPETFTLPEQTKEALREWIELRGASSGPLFVNFNRAPRAKEGRLSGRSVDRILKSWGKKLGLKLNPHGLRHAAITEALDLTSGNVRAVQRFSRHKDVRVLSVYDDNRSDLGGEVARLVAGTA